MSVSKPTIAKKNFVKTARQINGKSNIQPAHELTVFNGRSKIITDVMSPAPNTNSLVNGTMIKYFLKTNAVDSIKNLTLRFQITMLSGWATLAPVAHWFSHMSIHDRGSGTELARYYDEILMFFQNAVSEDVSNQWAKLSNYNPKTLKEDETARQDEDTTRYYYLSLPASIFDNNSLDLSLLKNDIEIRLHPVSTICVAGTSGVPSLLEVACMIETSDEDRESRHAKATLHNNNVVSHNYLNSQVYEIVGQTMAPSTKYEFDLDAFDHVSAGLLVAIRPTGSTNLEGGRQSYMDMYNGTVDVVGPSGVSIYAGGRPIPYEYIKNILAPQHVGSKYFEKCSLIPIMFGDLNKAMGGQIDGYNKFDGSKQRLQLTTPAVGVSKGYTLNNTTVPTAGKACFGFRGAYTTYMAFNSSASTLANTINAMTTMIDADLECSVDVALNDAGGDVIFSFSRKGTGQAVYLPHTEFGIIGDNAYDGICTITTVRPVEGWLASASYDISIYSLNHQTLHQDNGRLVTEVV